MTEIELLQELVSLFGDLLYLLRVGLLIMGCICGFLSAWMVFEFVKYRKCGSPRKLDNLNRCKTTCKLTKERAVL